MVTLMLKILSALLLYVLPFFQKSVKALTRSNEAITEATGNDTKKKGFDFRDIVEENSMYSPFTDKCPLRIYGGSPVHISELPYQVVIRKSARRGQVWAIVCGGSIVTDTYVMTAAHCFERPALKMLGSYRVVAGTTDSNWFYSMSKQRQELEDLLLADIEVWRKIKNVYTHAYYNPRYINHDLAVLHLEYPVSFSKTVQPIPMLKYTHRIPLEEKGLCLVSGYGLKEYRTASSVLRMVCVPLVTSANCRKHYGRYSVTNYQFCAGDNGKDSCQGDSGGPVTYKGYLVGIVSYGGECGKAPGVYTLVTAYTTGANVPFIKGHCVVIKFNTHGTMILVFLTYVYNSVVVHSL